MKYVIAGSTGFIGRSLVKQWREQKKEVLFIGRSKNKIQKIFGQDSTIIEWSELQQGKYEILQGAKVFVNLAGAGIADKRWSKLRKNEIINSRKECTNLLAKVCARLNTEGLVLINASAVGIYGIQECMNDGLPPLLDENSPIASDLAFDFLSKVCRQWEESTFEAKKAGARVINLRLGVVLGKSGGALSRMAMPFYLFAGGSVGSGKQPLPWIGKPDVLGAIDFIIENTELSGPVNLVAPHCLIQKDFANILGKVLNRPSFFPTPGFILKLVLGQMASELLLSGQNVSPKKLLDSGYKFLHPTLESSLRNIYVCP